MKIGYLATFITTVSLGLLSVGGFNTVIDSLWYFQGNQITGRNFSFDERLSKTNRFLNTYQDKNYNCIILGSSRSTLLREDYLETKGDRCFNYSISAGIIEEYIEYANFLNSLDFKPERVYVGIDAFNFSRSFLPQNRDTQARLKNILEKQIAMPAPVYRAYLSWDVLAFNYRTTIQKQYTQSNYRFYDRKFQTKTLESLPAYKAKLKKKWKPIFCDPNKYQYYGVIRKIFPKAEIIGYVPPVASWKMFNDFYMRNIANCMLSNLSKISEIYDEVYDFAMPSEITQNPKHTYDGSHFYLPVQEKIAEILVNQPQQQDQLFGYRVRGRSPQEYQQEFHKNMKTFVLSEDREDLWEEHLKRAPHEKTQPNPSGSH